MNQLIDHLTRREYEALEEFAALTADRPDEFVSPRDYATGSKHSRSIWLLALWSIWFKTQGQALERELGEHVMYRVPTGVREAMKQPAAFGGRVE